MESMVPANTTAYTCYCCNLKCHCEPLQYKKGYLVSRYSLTKYLCLPEEYSGLH